MGVLCSVLSKLKQSNHSVSWLGQGCQGIVLFPLTDKVPLTLPFLENVSHLEMFCLLAFDCMHHLLHRKRRSSNNTQHLSVMAAMYVASRKL